MNVSIPSHDASRQDNLMKALVAGGAVFLLWKLLSGVRSLLWTAFGLAMAVHWSGMSQWWS